MRITISLPCYQRPQRTIRAIECIMNQSVNGWEALIGGDCCPNINSLMESGYFIDLQRICVERGNRLIVYNLPSNHKGFGYAITNKNIQMAGGKYFTFFANDDVIKPNHFENYLSVVESDESIDMAIFKTYIEPINVEKPPSLDLGNVGHSQLIVRTSIAQNVPPHSPNYDHDFVFIKSIINTGAKVQFSHNPPTYVVKSIPSHLEVGIN